MSRLSAEDIRELRAALAAGSAGPWLTARDNHIDLREIGPESARIVWSDTTGRDTCWVTPGGPDNGNADARLIALAVNVLPYLLDEIEKLRGGQ